MYARYVRTGVSSGVTRYAFEERMSLFGCNNGFIPWLLSLRLPQGQGEPHAWHIDVVAELGSHPDYVDSTLLIDLKPKQNKTNLSLYELLDVWGYSAFSWSPILLRLSGLFVDEDPTVVDRESFVRRDEDIDGPIYEFLYIDGSVARGQLVGTWRPPPASPTKAALLWPAPLKYFTECMRAKTPEVFAE